MRRSASAPSQVVADATGAAGVAGVREVQLVTTRADVGSVISGGTFRLSFDYLAVTDQDPRARSRTGLLGFNATADAVKAALEARAIRECTFYLYLYLCHVLLCRGRLMCCVLYARGTSLRGLQLAGVQGLDLIGVVEVIRSGPDAAGSFTWQVTLDWTTRRGPLPPLVPSEVLFNAPWSGAGLGVVVRELRQGSLGAPMCSTSCSQRVGGLSPGSGYQFRCAAAVTCAGRSRGVIALCVCTGVCVCALYARGLPRRSVLAHNANGWSAPSGASDLVFTLVEPPADAASAVVAPLAATVLSIPAPFLGAILDADVGSDTVALRWQPVDTAVNGVDAYAVQYRVRDVDTLWTAVRVRVCRVLRGCVRHDAPRGTPHRAGHGQHERSRVRGGARGAERDAHSGARLVRHDGRL